MKRKDLTGQKFNMLSVLGFDHKGKNGLSYYLCKCDCGTNKVICGTDISASKTKSCGCFHRKWPLPQTLPNGQAAFNSLFSAYKGNAKSRGLVFSLSKNYFKEVTSRACVYCGVLPYKQWRGTNKVLSPYTYNGVDRVDNEFGYTEENVVPCCEICNKAKHALSLTAFIEWIARLVKFQNLKETVKPVGKN